MPLGISLELELPDILDLAARGLGRCHLRALPGWGLDVLDVILGFYLDHCGFAVYHRGPVGFLKCYIQVVMIELVDFNLNFASLYI